MKTKQQRVRVFRDERYTTAIWVREERQSDGCKQVFSATLGERGAKRNGVQLRSIRFASRDVPQLIEMLKRAHEVLLDQQIQFEIDQAVAFTSTRGRARDTKHSVATTLGAR